MRSTAAVFLLALLPLPASAAERSFSGTVEHIDRKDGYVFVKRLDGTTETVQLKHSCVFFAGLKTARFADLAAGQRVTVTWNGEWASEINIRQGEVVVSVNAPIAEGQYPPPAPAAATPPAVAPAVTPTSTGFPGGYVYAVPVPVTGYLRAAGAYLTSYDRAAPQTGWGRCGVSAVGPLGVATSGPAGMSRGHCGR